MLVANILYKTKGNRQPSPYKKNRVAGLFYKPEREVSAFRSIKHYKEMKKIIVLVMATAVLTIFNGCQKDELNVRQLTDEVQPQAVVKPDVYVENGYLAFKNMNAVDSVIQLLNKMTTPEKEAWESQIGLKSARADFDILFDKYEKLQSYDEFLSFKEQNKDKLVFNESDPEDCSIDYPYATRYFLPVLNNEGVYKVGISIIKYTKEDQIVIADGDTKKLKNIYAHANDKNVIMISKLKSSTNTTIDYFENNDPRTGRNDLWHTKDSISDRRINNQLYVEQYLYSWFDYNVNMLAWDNGIKVMLNQRGQKHTILGWKDYYTTYGITEIKCKIGTFPTYEDIRSHISAEVKPSIDFLLAHYGQTTYYQPSSYLSIPSISFAAKVTFRGFGFESYDYYLIDHPDSYGLGSSNSYPATGWGW